MLRARCASLSILRAAGRRRCSTRTMTFPPCGFNYHLPLPLYLIDGTIGRLRVEDDIGHGCRRHYAVAVPGRRRPREADGARRRQRRFGFRREGRRLRYFRHFLSISGLPPLIYRGVYRHYCFRGCRSHDGHTALGLTRLPRCRIRRWCHLCHRELPERRNSRLRHIEDGYMTRP